MPLLNGKDRGKSAAAVVMTTTASVAGAAAAAHHQHHSHGAPAPLRIESVLPTLLGHQPRQHRRSGINGGPHGSGASRSMYRSYSTLSSAHLHKATTAATAAAAATAQPDAEQLANAAGAVVAAGAPTAANGFWRVQRTDKEKEKLPDRINLDRRGLTALPVIEDEPGLRLLSLQHNLINSFCVPALAAGPAAAVTAAPASASAATVADPPRKQPATVVRHMSTRNLFAGSPLQRKSSATASIGANGPAGHQAHLPHRSAALLHVKDRIQRMRKSCSVINGSNGPTHASQHQRFTSKLHQLRALHPSAAASFSTDSGQSDAEPHKVTPARTAAQLAPPVASNGAAAAAAAAQSTTTTLCDSLIVRNEAAFSQQHRQHLESLVFIDLYDNQIEKISSLDGLQSLTVLLLGKNRIRDIGGLAGVRRTLRVLDLHGNRIAGLGQRISQLQELKSLNLAGNCLRQVHADDFRGLINLRELNLKRNRIRRLAGFEDLRSLERLWLCHNDVQRVEDMAAVASAIQLREVTVENNPVSLAGDCVSFLVSYLPALQLLSQMPVTEQVRRAAHAWRRSKETTDANYSDLSSDVCQSLRREEIISNARTNWELLRGQPQPTACGAHAAKRATAGGAGGSGSPTSTTATTRTTDAHSSDRSEGSSKTATPDRRSFSVVRQKAITSRLREMKKASVHGRARRRSVSQDNAVQRPHTSDKLPAAADMVSVSDQQLFRLPPILAPFLTVNGGTSACTEDAHSQSESSVCPNVDSSSTSYVSSDNEATDENCAVGTSVSRFYSQQN